MPDSIRYVHPKLEFVPPRYAPWVLRVVHACVPVLLRFRTRPWLTAGIRRVEAENGEVLAELFHKFQSGSIRLMIAFRHVEVDDPICGLQLLSRVLPRIAKHHNILLNTPLHAHFVYERGMSLWAGRWLNWLFSRMGGIPIRRGRKPDWTGLRAARHLLTHGTLPLAIAPEGATNGHSERVGPCEPGGSQLGFWCVEDLKKEERPEAVFIVPVGIQYRYITPPWSAIDQLLTQLEQDCGLSPLTTDAPTNDPVADSYPRLIRLGEHLLTVMESFYQRFYPTPIAALEKPVTPNEEFSLGDRLHKLMDTALRVAEQRLGVAPIGNFVDRCRRLEEAGWTRIYRDDLHDRNDLPPIERGLADWVAQDASLQMLHMRLVESFVAVTGYYVKDKPSAERFAETALLMFDLTARLRGDKLPKRPQLGDRWVQMTVGDPISVSDRWDDYKENRRRAIADLTADLQHALESTIG
ncbi:MAG: 1-acyl-sn-glycerol-3-phosphate acyltransferase [Leptolyngbyaceae bacterium]|nr:1-acyl-sn-glycerol-3-phosphate acyltransferase [Leptolyngbyaceae bacterium]